jgi:hypothetical protein
MRDYQLTKTDGVNNYVKFNEKNKSLKETPFLAVVSIESDVFGGYDAVYFGKHRERWNFQNNIRNVVIKFRGINVLTAVVMKSIVFRDVTPCSPVKVNWRFGGISTDYTALYSRI